MSRLVYIGFFQIPNCVYALFPNLASSEKDPGAACATAVSAPPQCPPFGLGDGRFGRLIEFSSLRMSSL